MEPCSKCIWYTTPFNLSFRLGLEHASIERLVNLRVQLGLVLIVRVLFKLFYDNLTQLEVLHLMFVLNHVWWFRNCGREKRLIWFFVCFSNSEMQSAKSDWVDNFGAERPRRSSVTREFLPLDDAKKSIKRSWTISSK